MKRVFKCSISDVKIILLGVLLIIGIAYSVYSTVRHFEAVNQVNEAKTIMNDIQNLLVWSSVQHQNNPIKVCNLQNIQQITQQQEFQKINQLLGWNINIQQHSKYIQSMQVSAASDLQGCVISTYFRKDRFVNDDLAGKYINYLYDFKTRTAACITNIQKRALVKYCTRL